MCHTCQPHREVQAPQKPISCSVREDKPPQAPIAPGQPPTQGQQGANTNAQCSVTDQEEQGMKLSSSICFCNPNLYYLDLEKSANIHSLGIKGGYTCNKSLSGNLTEGERNLEVDAAVIWCGLTLGLRRTQMTFPPGQPVLLGSHCNYLSLFDIRADSPDQHLKIWPGYYDFSIAWQQHQLTWSSLPHCARCCKTH